MIMADNSRAINKPVAGVKVIFCGVGEAFDENLTNTSILVSFLHRGEYRFILLDCGFTAAPAFWKTSFSPLDLDGIWISHLHGDHFMGLPQLLIRFSEHGREKKLHVCGGKGIKEAVTWAMDLAYPGKMGKLPFHVAFSDVDPAGSFDICEIPAKAVDIDHPLPCLGLRLDFEGKSLFYTGDGNVPDAAQKIVRGSDLGIFETFTLDTKRHGHSNVVQAGSFAGSAGIKLVAAVHMHRHERKINAHLVKDKLDETGVKGFLPEPGDVVEL